MQHITKPSVIPKKFMWKIERHGSDKQKTNYIYFVVRFCGGKLIQPALVHHTNTCISAVLFSSQLPTSHFRLYAVNPWTGGKNKTKNGDKHLHEHKNDN